MAASSSSSSSSEASEKQVLAPKRSKGSSLDPKPSQAPKPKPFPSSADDEESSDGDDSGDNSKPPTQQPLKPTSDSGSTDGDSDSESSDQAPPSPRRSSRVADPSIKPLVSKPMDGSSTASTPAPASIQETKKEKKTPAPTPASIIQDTKQQQQKVPEHESGGQNRKLFQRIWSEDDEIAVLSGMIDYHAKKGLVPSSVGHMDDFRDFIQKSLQMEVSKTQLADKVRRVRNKYHTATARSKNGADPSFTKPHERTIYELSKEIWGPKKKISPGAGAGAGDVSKSKKRKRSKIPTTFAITTDKGNDPVKVNFPYPFLRDAALLHIGNGHPGCLIVAKMALESLDNSKALELEEKCKKFKLSEMKHHLQLLDITKEVVKLIMDAIV